MIFLEHQDKRIELIKAWARSKNYSVLLNESNLEVLRNLSLSQVVVQTESHLGRGYDYRSKRPIALFAGKVMPHCRSYMQLLGRIGRYDDGLAKRFTDVLLGDDVVDTGADAAQDQCLRELELDGLFQEHHVAAKAYIAV